MSLFGSLNTAVSGMTAQASYLSAIGDNIANSSTVGYKNATTNFETQLGNQVTNSYSSGGVQSKVTYAVTGQGSLATTTSSTDLAISGNGFFVVKNTGNDTTALTRAGSFVANSAGNLINTAGYELLGYKLSGNVTDTSSDTAANLVPVNVSSDETASTPSTTGSMTFNVDSAATAVTGDTPSSNASDAAYTSKTSLTAYDNLGNAVTVDVYLTKTSDNTWEATTYNAANAAAGGGFPYSSGPLSSQTLNYNSTTGALSSVDGSSSPLNLTVPVPNGQTLTVDVSNTTQLATAYTTNTTTMNGNAPSALKSVSVSTDGVVSAVYTNGTTKAIYKVPVATVASPDSLTSLSGDAYTTNLDSGAMSLTTAGTGGSGTIAEDSLESSTVDLATELTSMIAAQRAYEANSKVLQASSDLLKTVDQLSG